MITLICITGLLTACELPQVSAEDRLFLNASLDFLGEYRLPVTDFEATRVGGLSALAYDRQRDVVYALSDDPGNQSPARFYTLKLTLNTVNSQPTLQRVDVQSVTLLTDEAGNSFAKGTIDPEGIALSPQRTIFVSSEGAARAGIAPTIQEFDLNTGQQRRSLPVPSRYAPAASDQPPQGVEDNQGFESLTLNPGGYGAKEVEPYRLFVATESPLIQDQTTSQDKDTPPRLANRWLHYLVEADRALLVSEHLYLLEPMPLGAIYHGLTDLVAIDQGGHFIGLERSVGLMGFQCKLFQLASGGATDTSTIDSFKDAANGIRPIQKRLLLDLNQLDISLENLEGMTIGPRLPDGSQSLLLISDDNFDPEQGTQVLLFRLKGIERAM